jgi:tetratricopeptide (TPR) repeat protein
MQAQLGRVLAERLRDTPGTQYRRQVEIYIMLEQFDRALIGLDKMLNEPRRWQADAKSGWLSGKAWECALLCRTRPPAPWISQQFEDWKVKEPPRIDAYVTDGGYSAAYKERLMKLFQEKQEYYAKDGPTIIEKLRELELKGDTDSAALLELKERCLAGRPDTPMTGLRVLYKLRDWYPELPAVKSGAVPLSLSQHLATGFVAYREASKEAENLMEKWPTCDEVTSGYGLYYAAEYAYLHAEHLAPNQSDGWTVLDRTRPVYKEAKEYWEKARQYLLRLRKDCPKHSGNQPSTSTGRTHVETRLAALAKPERLGPTKP